MCGVRASCAVTGKQQELTSSSTYMIQLALLWVAVAVDDESIVCLVNEVRAAADVVQVGRLPAPALQLARSAPRTRHARRCAAQSA